MQQQNPMKKESMVHKNQNTLYASHAGIILRNGCYGYEFIFGTLFHRDGQMPDRWFCSLGCSFLVHASSCHSLSHFVCLSSRTKHSSRHVCKSRKCRAVCPSSSTPLLTVRTSGGVQTQQPKRRQPCVNSGTLSRSALEIFTE